MDAATNESSSDSSCTVVGSGSSADNVNSALVWLGTAMVIAASFVSCFGLNLQKLSHNQNEEKDQADRKPMYKSWTWVLGLGCMVLGSILDVLALPFVPMSRVSALGASGMIANIMITPLFLKETVTNHDLLGGTVTIVGTTIACYFGAQSEPVISSDCLLENFTQDMFIFFAIVVAVMIAVLVYLMIGFKKTQEAAVEAGLTVQYLECVSAWQKLEDLQSLPQDKTFRFFTQFGPQFYPVVFAVFAGTVGAFSVMFVKAALIFLENAIRGDAVGKSIGLMFAFLLPTAFLMAHQIQYLNTSLQIYRDALFVLPVYQALWISAGIISGLIFYREYEQIAQGHMALFILGVVIALLGIVVLSFRKSGTPDLPSPRPSKEFLNAARRGSKESVVSVSTRASSKKHARFKGFAPGNGSMVSHHTLLGRGSLAESFSLRPGDFLGTSIDPIHVVIEDEEADQSDEESPLCASEVAVNQ